MTTIDTDYSVAALYASQKLSKKTVPDMPATAAAPPPASITMVTISESAKLVPDFAAELSSSLSAYGVNTPPALRITAGPNGLELADDNRNTRFQNMLRDRPDLGSQLSDMLSQAQAARQTAMDKVMNDFAGSNPSASTSDFLDDFKDSEQAQAFSIKFDGGKAVVQEKSDKGWQTVKNDRDFTSDLLQAYIAYMQKNQAVSTEEHTDKKKNSDADDDLRKRLADDKKNIAAEKA